MIINRFETEDVDNKFYILHNCSLMDCWKTLLKIYSMDYLHKTEENQPMMMNMNCDKIEYSIFWTIHLKRVDKKINKMIKSKRAQKAIVTITKHADQSKT